MAIVTTISAIIGIAGKMGWFTQAEFADEILGEWGDRGLTTAGLVLDLETQTGQIYPELRRMRDEAIDKYSKFRNALPWNKGSTAKAYHEKVQDLAQGIEREAKSYQTTFGLSLFEFPISSKMILILALIPIGILMLFLVMGRKRR